jgi:hypothetical protein
MFKDHLLLMNKPNSPSAQENPQTTTTSNVLRHSVAAMEKSKRDKRIAQFIFIAVSMALAFITPIYVIRGLGIIPQFPDVGQLKSTVDEYYEFVNRLNRQLANEIYANYSNSLAIQGKDCDAKTSFGYAELARIPKNSEVFANGYCDSVVLRLLQKWTEFGVARYSTPNCAYALDASTLPSYLVWATNAAFRDPDPAISGARIKASNQSNSIYATVALNPVPVSSTCGINAFDNWEITTGYNSFSLQCLTYENLMKNNVSALNSTKNGYVDSAKKLVDYNNNFGNSLKSYVSSLVDSTNQIRSEVTSARINLKDMYSSMQSNAEKMQSSYKDYKKMFDDISIVQPITGINLYSSPGSSLTTLVPFPEQDLANLEAQYQSIRIVSNQFASYNPPEVVWPQTEVQSTVTVLNVTLSVPSISLKDSILVKELYVAFKVIKNLIEIFLAYDLGLRICLWLQDLAFLFLEPRRNFIKVTTTCKTAIAFIVERLSLILYTSIVIIIIIVIAAFTYNPDTVVSELKTLCNNQVLVKNSDQLAKYQNEIISRKGTCNNVILQTNAQLNEYNRRYVDMLDSFSKNYETFYNSTKMDPADVSTYCSTFRCVSNMSLPATNLPKKGSSSENQTITPIESFKIANGLCSDSPEATAVNAKVATAVTEIRNYVLSLLLIGLGTLIALKGLIWGLKRWFYMELTTGYILEMEVSSKMLQSRIRTYKIQAIAMWIFSILLFVLNITVFSSLARKDTPSY